ncbi:substance-K receptor-like [Acropora muricata]|uniref:substance-K receptor-like n=1 Tax=Acropora muricata TaxID=159855 RepID=UPI0034E4E2DF
MDCCKTAQYSRAIGQAVSLESLLLIVVERYVAIVRPFQSVLITRRLRITLVSSTWISALLIAFPYVWTSQIIEADGEQPDQQNLRRIHQQNHDVMKTFLLIVIAFFICWTPVCVHIVLRKTFPASLFPTNSCKVYLVMFFYLFPSLSTVSNPIILFLSSTRFSVALKEMSNCFTRNSPLCCRSHRVTTDIAML